MQFKFDFGSARINMNKVHTLNVHTLTWQMMLWFTFFYTLEASIVNLCHQYFKRIYVDSNMQVKLFVYIYAYVHVFHWKPFRLTYNTSFHFNKYCHVRIVEALSFQWLTCIYTDLYGNRMQIVWAPTRIILVIMAQECAKLPFFLSCFLFTLPVSFKTCMGSEESGGGLMYSHLANGQLVIFRAS